MELRHYKLTKDQDEILRGLFGGNGPVSQTARQFADAIPVGEVAITSAFGQAAFNLCENVRARAGVFVDARAKAGMVPIPCICVEKLAE